MAGSTTPDESDVDINEQDMADRVNNRTLRPNSATFQEFMTQGWGEQEAAVKPLESSQYIGARLTKLGKRFPGERLVIPAGDYKTRNNDNDYPFRPDSAFAYYTGLGEDLEPGAILVLDPLPADSAQAQAGATHQAELFVHPRADQSTRDYYRSSQYGEYWVGPRAGLQELSVMTGLPTRDIAEFESAIASGVGPDDGSVRLRVLRHTDQGVTAQVEAVRKAKGQCSPDEGVASDNKFEEFASEARMIKDAYEVGEMRKAIAATKDGFDKILSRLPEVVGKPRSERMLEGAFNANAREEGNDVGYGSIIASGSHAPVLHWMRNNGTVRQGDLLLIDAGVEVNSLYTADITRTFPVGGHFSPIQRRIYETVLEAQQTAFEAAQPGATYSDIHHTVMRVLATRLHEWGILKVSVEESLSPQGQQHRRWHACGCAHHLGLDVHDCAEARYESYQGAAIEPGMIFTIEPGLYFKDNDLLVPPEFRGIGVRIEDDVLMTEDGPVWLSKQIPKTVDEVEAWMAQQAKQDR
ncbi:xaa-pro aminopeptidase PepP [Bifidobacterium actinocoloniiforme DSM 22766]|uniref:Xaa-Pro aminopeptidase n=1 Tax=Bifidobacterium actinocoloniiforme DSM 22766 TaxID=1437605 RepID=A0A086Z0Z6_9BIFI|nr:aminopeptidase P family protein [Bifidobacterium actinocoloniiforme]AKV55378.1 Xaa-Pro aminopeptidase [Bifidobacterium actinocoloniiforme DSM 22766]KFI40196.1 xaa-pro aminopeptidase PepP [Bifidobacterium actinocoloniiforme DSM 22766]